MGHRDAAWCVHTRGVDEKWVLLECYVIDTPTPCRFDGQAGKTEAFLVMKVSVKTTTYSVILGQSPQSPLKQWEALDSAKAPRTSVTNTCTVMWVSCTDDSSATQYAVNFNPCIRHLCTRGEKREKIWGGYPRITSSHEQCRR